MERSGSVIKTAPMRFLVLLLCIAALLPASAEESLVLIVSAQSHVVQLDSLEVRKLFLGMTVAHGGDRLRPLLNETDSRVKEVFLQNIVSMTELSYDRRVLRLALQSGRSIPDIYTDKQLLFNAISEDPAAVSYAWAKDVQYDKRIRVLRVLWHD
jgi:hypothetical protein